MIVIRKPPATRPYRGCTSCTTGAYSSFAELVGVVSVAALSTAIIFSSSADLEGVDPFIISSNACSEESNREKSSFNVSLKNLPKQQPDSCLETSSFSDGDVRSTRPA